MVQICTNDFGPQEKSKNKPRAISWFSVWVRGRGRALLGGLGQVPRAPCQDPTGSRVAGVSPAPFAMETQERSGMARRVECYDFRFCPRAGCPAREESSGLLLKGARALRFSCSTSRTKIYARPKMYARPQNVCPTLKCKFVSKKQNCVKNANLCKKENLCQKTNLSQKKKIPLSKKKPFVKKTLHA